MIIVKDFPPNIEEIRSRFKLKGSELFCWGNKIYVPSGKSVAPQLIAHEKVHCRQQGDDIEGWWSRYLEDAEFRFDQELEAHQVEYKAYCHNGANRGQRRMYLRMMSRRLASAMYGNVCTAKEAKKKILEKQ